MIGLIVRNKTKLVIQDSTQHVGIDFEETFTPVTHHEYIKILLIYASHKTLSNSKWIEVAIERVGSGSGQFICCVFSDL
jgi:hypothetical protein